MEKIRLSPSRVNDFSNCPQLYKYRVIDQIPEEISLDAERGKLVHSILESLFDAHSSERTLPHALSLVADKWRKQVESQPGLHVLVSEEKEWFDRVSSLLATYFTLEEPATFDATARELHLELDFTEGVYLHGYVDRLDIAPTGEVRIVDYKTGKSPRSGWEEKALFQLRIYALIYWKNTGVLPRLLQLIYLGDAQLVKSQPTELDLLKTERKLHEIAEEIADAITSGVWKAKKSRLCDWCSFKPICPAHKI
ncbi:MAG: PD-(D/E)XK nuclease family protein [Actinobacteria bacterium]|nr:PD-(D/E)XK nuclease family protein [Actinomycetota bacterium]